MCVCVTEEKPLTTSTRMPSLCVVLVYIYITYDEGASGVENTRHRETHELDNF